MLMHAYIRIRHPCKSPSENHGYRLGWNPQKPAKQYGNDTTTLLHHPYILCHVPTTQTMKLSICTLDYSHLANESYWVHTVTPLLHTEFSLHTSCTLWPALVSSSDPMHPLTKRNSLVNNFCIQETLYLAMFSSNTT